MGRAHVLETSVFVPVPRERVFAFFADAFNLEAITPALLRFHVLTPAPIEMRPGVVIDYRLRLRGVPMRWRSEISAYDPPARFVDEQRRGPYRVWHHEHTFEEVPAREGRPAGTLVKDRVTYEHIGGALVHRLFVRPDLERIFAYRQRRIVELLTDARSASPAVAGGMLSAC
jgi:ligand-binding SRPBCC domain-containing protein